MASEVLNGGVSGQFETSITSSGSNLRRLSSDILLNGFVIAEQKRKKIFSVHGINYSPKRLPSGKASEVINNNSTA
jgi:archaellum component FlaF (FlaF/FlaG flagellin family)